MESKAIHFESENRPGAPPLVTQEQRRVVEITNQLLSCKYIPTQEDVELLQRFVDVYQNMAHYVAYTSGLWATEDPEAVADYETTLFQLDF